MDRGAILGLIVDRSLTVVLMDVIPGLLIAAAVGLSTPPCYVGHEHAKFSQRFAVHIQIRVEVLLRQAVAVLVSRIFTSWNHVTSVLLRIQALRQAA
jgi:hypothetical protein